MTKLTYQLNYLADELDRQATALNTVVHYMARRDNLEDNAIEEGNIQLMRLVIDRLNKLAMDTKKLLKDEGYEVTEEGN